MTTIILRLLPKKLLLSLLILVSFSAGATNYIFYNNTGNWTDPSRWSAYPGTTINAGDSVTITFGGNCIIPAVTNITINGTLYIQNTSTLNNLGSLLINNVLTIEQGGSLSNSGTWTYYKGKGRNSGTITTSSTGRTGIRGILINDGTITNNGTFGIIGVNGGPNGLINNSTFATINNAGLFTNIGAILNSGTFSNSGTFLDSLVFQLNDLGTFTNTGTMKIPYLGSLYINNATTVTNESTGIIQSASNISVFGSFVNNGTLNSTYQVGISGTFVNNGSVTSSYYFGTHSFGTLVNNGAITINPAPAADTEGRPQAYISTLGNSEYFANASTGVVTLTANTRLQNSDTLDNAGSILINANAAFENYFGTNRNMGVVLNSGTINNSGAVRNGGVIKDLLNSQFLNTGQMSNTGSIEEGGSFTNTGNFDNDSSLYISMLYYTGFTGKFQNKSQALLNIKGMMTNEGTMTLSDTSLLAVTGSFNNYAKLYMIGQAVLQNNGRVMNSSTNTPKTALLDNNATFINTGDFTNNAPFYNRNSFQNQQAGTVYLIDLFDSPGNVINYGAFVNTDSLVIRGRFDNNAGGRLSNSRNYIIIMNSGLLSNTPNGIVINGIGLTVASEKALAPLQYSYLINYGGFSNGGYLTNNSTMINQNFFDNYSPGRNPMNTDSYFTNNSQFTNTGRINNLGFIINSGFGVIQHNAKVFNNIFVIRNNGRLTIASDATFAISAGFCTNGYLIDNQGTMTCANQLILVNYFAASILGFSGPYLNYKVTTQPSNVTVPTNGTAAFTVATSGTQVAYQWQVSTDQGFTWTDLTNGSNYSGVTTASLRITNTPGSFNNYMYRAHVTGPQTGNDGDSDRATLTVSGNLKPFALKQ